MEEEIMGYEDLKASLRGAVIGRDDDERGHR
jgi:hypothetical protein